MKENTSIFEKNIFDALTEKDYSDISSRIRQLRTDILKMSQQDFSSAINISQAELSYLEKGQRQLTSNKICRIIETFNLNLEWFLFGIGDSVFCISGVNKSQIQSEQVKSSIKKISDICNLDDAETAFIQRFLSMSHDNRMTLLSLLKYLSD